ncbi:MAG: mptA [Pseudonocardiales bacterium]|nr:mptA [Pseudonocardiales bacterium]
MRVVVGAFSVHKLGAVGFAGSIGMSVASFWVGAVPMYFRTGSYPVVSILPVGAVQARLVFYLGLAAMSWAWLRIGAITLRSSADVDWRPIRRIALWWSAPLAFAIPLSSRDLWAYAAQSQLIFHHLDPYSLGPSALPGAFSVEVSHRWIDSPAPYGPLWLSIGRGLAAIIGEHVGITVAALRLLSILGLVLLAFSLPTLAVRAGGRPSIAVWLMLANPLTLVLGVGGGHNDLLMVGLMTVGLTVLTGPGSVLRTLIAGTVILTAAVAIKSPAAVALAFGVPLWLIYARSSTSWRSWRGVLRASLIVFAISSTLFAVITWASGLGLGWVKQVNSSTTVVSWMSLPTCAAMLWDLATLRLHRALKFDSEMVHIRTVGSVVSVIVLLVLWFVAVRAFIPAVQRRPLPHWLHALNVWQLLALALLSIVVLGPTVQPWYYSWSLAIAACTLTHARWLTIFAGLSIGMVVVLRPNGVGLQMNPAVVPILAISVALAFRALRPAELDDQVLSHPAVPETTKSRPGLT